MPYELNMPQLSDTMTEGTLVKWNKKVGDTIKAGDEVADVETDKATMPMECAEAGTLVVTLVGEGGKVPVGGTLGVVALKGENVDEVKAKYSGSVKSGAAGPPANKPRAESSLPPAATEAKPEPKLQKLKVEYGGEIAVGDHSADQAVEDFSPRATETSSSGHTPPSNGNGARIRISPLARRIATDMKIDLSTVKGSGPGGRIVQSDILSASSRVAAEPAPRSATPGAGTPAKQQPEVPARVAAGASEKIVLTRMRQVIATRLQQSKQTIPHFYETLDIDMTQAVELRKRLLAAYEKSEGIRISIGDIIAKAVASTLKAVPQMNSTFDEKTSTVTRYGDVNLGIAVALPDGLIVPVLRSIDQMGIKEIRQRSAEIVDRARSQRLKRDEMSGATFTVSNLGIMGIRDFSAIVNPPEVGILAIGASEDRAVVRNGQIVARTMMTVTLSCDHRVIDGAVAATFLTTLKSFLEEPAMMLS